MKEIKNSAFYCIILLALVCCTPEKNWQSETIEIYTVLPGDKKYSRDKLSYKEINFFNELEILVERHFYDKSGTFKAKEIFDINKEGLARGSDYYDNNGTLLSYYKFDYNTERLPNQKMAYDGTNDELLRIEEYQYDERGNRITKRILDQSSTLSRTYGFGFDEFGNEIFMAVMDSLGNEIFTENYSITRKDPDGRYLQSWGLIGDDPKTVKYRTFEKIFKPESIKG